MRVAVDARPLIHPHSGIGRYTREILRGLRALCDWEFVLYTDRISSADWPGFSVINHPGLARRTSASLFAQWHLPRWCRRDAIDLFFSPRHHLPLALDVPTVVTIHDLVWKRAPQTMMPFGRLLEACLMPASVRKATSVIAVSQSTKRDLEVFFPTSRTKTTVVLEASSFTNQGAATTADEAYLLFVGTFEPRKNLERLIRAYKACVAAGVHGHHLWLAGSPGWKTDVADLIERENLADRVRIIPVVSDEQLGALYAGCTALVMPSLYEGFGLPIVEALAFGKPVLVGANSAMPEVAGDAAVAVDPYDIRAIQAGLTQLCTDQALLTRLRANARVQSGRFSWRAASLQTLDVLRSAAARG